MAALFLALSQALILTAFAEPTFRKGVDVHCIQNRAHLVHYDVAGEPNNGSSMEGIQHAVISVEPSSAHAEHCASKGLSKLLTSEPTGDKKFCYGVNQDDSCAAAKAEVPIDSYPGLSCANCYLSASADAYYKLNYSATHLHSVEIGLRDIQLRASASLHMHLATSGPSKSGSIKLPGSDDTHMLINKLVGCPVCVMVTIRVAVPTTLDYTVALTDAECDIDAGASLDINLGDNVVKYDHVGGWTHEYHQPVVKVSPIISVTAKATAKVDLSVSSSLQVDVDKIIWYHLNMKPALPTTLAFKGAFWPLHKAEVCIDGDASFDMEQEANLDWNLIVWHEKKHWGPSNLYSWSKSGIIHGCKSIGNTSEAETIVV